MAQEVYPLRSDYPETEHSEAELMGNLLYLEEHGLVDAGIQISLDNHFGTYGFKATAKGLDFIADDGGLSAILGVVTVRLHEDSIKALLLRQIEESSEPSSVKESLAHQVRELPAEALKSVTTKALEAGLKSMPHFISMLHSWLSSHG
jgi:hypothetical protein